jgi:hypothetical protein
MFRKISLSIAAVTVGILILAKVFIYTDCYSFDSHDEANHAFPGLHVAQTAILAGELPTINFYNNFGAPLLGDALTYPFALQAVTYYFLDSHLAMTVNRFFIAVLTVITAFGFFRIYLGVFPALICAVLIFFNPVAFWYPVHQYQMAAPFFFASFYLLNKFHIHKSALYFFSLFMLFCAMILSVSINHVVLMIPFLLIWSFCRNGFRVDRVSIAPLAALACAVVFSYPQTFEFVRNFLASARASEGVYDSILTTPRELFLGLIIPPGEWIAYNYGAQLQVTTYLSMPVMLAVLSGVWLIRKKNAWKRTSLFFCGVLPTVIAIILYMNSGLRFKIPFVKSMDITRVFWFSIPFCYVYVGYFIAYARVGRLPRSIAVFLLIASFATLAAIPALPETSEVSALHSIILLLVAVGALILLLIWRNGRPTGSHASLGSSIGGSLLIGSLILVPIPVIARVLGLNTGSCGGTQYSASLAASRFMPYSLLGLMEKGNRLATEIHTHKGHDLRVAAHEILGSDARGIVVDKQFGKFLEDKRLVTVDQVPYGYYFSRPWQTDELSRLGIRYLLVNRSPDIELEGKGWKRLGEAENLSLYENPVKPTPVYLIKNHTSAPDFVHDYRFLANQVQINLPEIPSASTLVLTILNRRGFEAEIDGRKTEIVTRDGFISLDMQPGDRIVKIMHHPYSWYHVVAGVGVAILVSALYSWFLSRRRLAEEKH